MKKFLSVIFLLMIIFAQASAMRLELEPQPIGKITQNLIEPVTIEGATKIDGESSKGIVLFGENFYFHFDSMKLYSRFGSRDKKNSVEVDTYGETKIFRIGNSDGADFYLLRKDNGNVIKVLGLRGGEWFQFFDLRGVIEKYDIDWHSRPKEFFTQDDKIIFRYQLKNHAVDVICTWNAAEQKFTDAIDS